MPFLDFDAGDDEEVELKFDDCVSCKFKARLRTCAQCDNGEFFEEQDPEGLDSIFRDSMNAY